MVNPGRGTMAEFEVMELEGVRFVRARLREETIRIEAGALACYRGSIRLHAAIPSIATVVKASLSEENSVRPTLTGSGDVVLESSVGGFHVFQAGGEAWILERGAYWASDAGVAVGVYRERVMNAFWAGDGLVDYATRIEGEGQVVVTTRGPAEELLLGPGETFACEARGVVIARTAGIQYRIRRPERSYLGSWLSGERALRVYTGPGRLVLVETPYWGAFLMEKLGARPEAANATRPPAEAAEVNKAS